MTNLRAQLPVYDTPELFKQWHDECLSVLGKLGELGVESAMGVQSRRIIFQLLRAMGAQDALDIGTFLGNSALVMALAGCRVVTVDARNVNRDRVWKERGRKRAPYQLMLDAGVADRVEFKAIKSADYLAKTERTFDFICIDGDHSAQAAYDDIRLSLPRLNAGGLILMDDVQIKPAPKDFKHPIPGPYQALDRAIKEGMPIKPIFIERGLDGGLIARGIMALAVLVAA